jgi:hypothetical protein
MQSRFPDLLTAYTFKNFGVISQIRGVPQKNFLPFIPSYLIGKDCISYFRIFDQDLTLFHYPKSYQATH